MNNNFNSHKAQDVVSSKPSCKTILYFGALLHDIGKVVYRIFLGPSHSFLGEEFFNSIRSECFQCEEAMQVAEQIRYHHAKEMKAGETKLEPNSLAYITYFADNISAGMDRKNEGDEEYKREFDIKIEMHKIFNILNANSSLEQNANSSKHKLHLANYSGALEEIRTQLSCMSISSKEINSLLNLLEAKTRDMPSSTNKHEILDVSLYDHAKTTAALAVCIYDYMQEKGITNYREALFNQKTSQKYYSEQMFLLVELDMTGIQDFIYNISGAGALKQLRARSLYLDFMMQHIVDELLERMNLYRPNALHIGGGGAYLLLPNTESTKQVLNEFQEELKNWFIAKHGTALYVAFAHVACTAEDLGIKRNNGHKFYQLLETLSAKLDAAKMSKYTAADIANMNFGDTLINPKPNAKRVYTKNSWDAGINLASHIWFGDYTAKMENQGYSAYSQCGVTLEPGKGIKRLGVLRLDVDNLGVAFSAGFPANKVSISRVATLSRSVSYFFQHKINEILDKAGYKLQIIYSGGDDLFAVGNWNDIIYAAMKIHKSWHEFTGNNSLTLSAGIGMFNETYPIARMACETGKLLDVAKAHVKAGGSKTFYAKNAVVLWRKELAFTWEELEDVVEPRMQEVAKIFKQNDKGKAFIYKMHALLCNFDQAISPPRLAYLLARSFDDAESNKCNKNKKDARQQRDAICDKFFNWAKSEKERLALITALEWYVYSTRER